MKFKEWLNLSEGVEVRVKVPPDKFKEPPATLLDLSFDIRNAMWKEMPSITFNSIDVDGDSNFQGTEGVLNFYTNRIPEGQHKQFVDLGIKTLNNLKVTVERVVANTYEDYIKKEVEKYPDQVDRKKLEDNFKQHGIRNLNSVRVYRLHVKMDTSLAVDNQPVVNMGFETARIVFEEIFGLPSAGANPMGAIIGSFTGLPNQEEGSWSGYNFEVDHIIKVYERIKDDLRMYADMESKSSHTLHHGEEIEDPEDQYNLFGNKIKYKGPTWHFGGVSGDLIFQRVVEVYKLALWGKKHGHKEMYAV